MCLARPSPSSRCGVSKANKSGTIFALAHLILLIAVAVYGLISLIQGNVFRSVFIFALLIGYYFLVLHQNVKKEISRKKDKRKTADPSPVNRHPNQG